MTDCARTGWNLKIGLSVIERLIDELQAMGRGPLALPHARAEFEVLRPFVGAGGRRGLRCAAAGTARRAGQELQDLSGAFMKGPSRTRD